MNDPVEKHKRSCLTIKGCLICFSVLLVFVIAIVLSVVLIPSGESYVSENDLNEAEEKAYFESAMLSLLRDEIDPEGHVIREWDCSDLKIKYRSRKIQTYEYGWEWIIEGTYSTETRKEKGTFHATVEFSKTEFGTTRNRCLEMVSDTGQTRTCMQMSE